MSIEVKQLYDFVVAPALMKLGQVKEQLDSTIARKLVLATALHESFGGDYLRQVLNNGSYGAAMGIYQIEAPTHEWIWSWLARQGNKPIQDCVLSALSRDALYPYHDQLMTNLRYATMMCRLRYYMAPSPLPASGDIESLANYWGKYYQTGSPDINKLENKELAFIQNVKRLGGEFFK